ncbi:putative ammonium transporter 1 isoform X1 [Magallana gigas]|uniref:putative ammonium transporter 1 isoform X1 n=1 Tax=Magallana gigas TaxID=29159 RepID=UPI003340AFAA
MTSVRNFSSEAGFWSFIIGFIFIQIGFVVREVGAVRLGDTKRILLRHVFNLILSGVVYCLIGYAFAFSDGGTADKFIGMKLDFSDEILAYKYILLQCIFASMTASIVSGAVAERCKFIAHFVYTVFITGLIHPVVRHWTLYNRGWLYNGDEYSTLDYARIGFHDDVGSGAVHVIGGIAALMGAMMIGPRTGRFDPTLKKDFTESCYSTRIAFLGGLVMAIGLLTIISESPLLFVINYQGDLDADSTIYVFTSGSFAGFCLLLLINCDNRYFGTGRSALNAINGGLTGMIAVSTGYDNYSTHVAIAVGVISIIVYTAYSLLLTRLGIDDPLDVVAVHFGGGSLGLIAVAFFHEKYGIFYAWNLQSAYILGWQCIGLMAIIVWTAVISGLMFGVLRLFGILRVCDEAQEKVAEFAKPAHKIKEITKENQKTVVFTVEASLENTCQKDMYLANASVGDLQL